MTKPSRWGVMLMLIGAFATSAAPRIASAKPDVAAKAQARVDAAAAVYASEDAQWRAGRATIESVCAWSVRWLDAQRDQPSKGKALKDALAAHLARVQAIATEADAQVKAGRASHADADVAAYYVAEAELWVARGK